MEIRTEVQKDANGSPHELVKIVWHGHRIAKMVFGSGKVIDFTRSAGAQEERSRGVP